MLSIRSQLISGRVSLVTYSIHPSIRPSIAVCDMDSGQDLEVGTAEEKQASKKTLEPKTLANKDTEYRVGTRVKQRCRFPG